MSGHGSAAAGLSGSSRFDGDAICRKKSVIGDIGMYIAKKKAESAG